MNKLITFVFAYVLVACSGQNSSEPVVTAAETSLICPEAAIDEKLLKAVDDGLMDPQNRSKLLSWEDNPCLSDPQCYPDNTRMAYAYQGITTDLFREKTDEGRVVLTFRQSHEHFVDSNLDGCVDSGWDDRDSPGYGHSYWGGYLVERLSVEDKEALHQPKYEAYWQARYNMAILDLADVLDVH